MRTVYMRFEYQKAWHVDFLDEDLRTRLPRRFTFQNPDKILQMIERGGGFKDSEHRMFMTHAIHLGRGGTYLTLTDEQYKKLR